MAEFTVEIRIFGSSLDHDEITRELDLVPDLSWAQGDPRGQGFFSNSMWSYHGGDPGEASPTMPDLQRGLVHLMDKLEPVKANIRTLAQRYHVVFWCGQFQSDSNGSYEINCETLERITEFGAALFVDNYFGD